MTYEGDSAQKEYLSKVAGVDFPTMYFHDAQDGKNVEGQGVVISVKHPLLGIDGPPVVYTAQGEGILRSSMHVVSGNDEDAVTFLPVLEAIPTFASDDEYRELQPATDVALRSLNTSGISTESVFAMES